MIAATLVFLCAVWPVHAGQLESLSWLAGCWRSETGEPGSVEHWLPLQGGTMLGVARTIRGGRTVDHEFLRLHEDERGTAIYTATPARQRETSFVAREVGVAGAMFENPDHDFPTRIAYTRQGEGRMVVRIEGERQGRPRAVEFPFSRVSCQR